MKKSIKQLFFEATQTAIGKPLDKTVFDKAYAKAKRWANSAYGEPDMQEFADESGYSLSFYYKECLENKKGMGTANQKQYQQNRKV